MAAPIESNQGDGYTPFKAEFKRYKRRKPPPDLSESIDFRHPEQYPAVSPVKKDALNVEIHAGDAKKLGLRPPNEWKMFNVKGFPGFIYIVDPFLPGFQRYWVVRCLKDFPNRPNICNLDAYTERADNLWESGQTSQRGSEIIHKLRWATLGYHYNWSAKAYDKDRRGAFPADLSHLTHCVAQACGFPKFLAEASIVNFYHLDSTLNGHTDHSELDLEAPLFSFSFGQSAIFLLGGHDLNKKPVAMYTHSGDVIVMAGPSRLAYHAVPRILKTDYQFQKCFCRPDKEHLRDHVSAKGQSDLSLQPDLLWSEDSTWEAFHQYLQSSRINLNIRQVFRPGVNFP